MIPPHTCTPFCDGQRYCVEPGTHTVATWGTDTVTEEGIREVFEPFNVDILKMQQEADAERPDRIYDAVSLELVENRTADVCWLVTVRDKEPRP